MNDPEKSQYLSKRQKFDSPEKLAEECFRTGYYIEENGIYFIRPFNFENLN